MKSKSKKKGTLDYPVSTKYRETWGEWECVREIVQNALDSGAKVKVDFQNGTMITRDWGQGFGLRQLLIGESSKDGISTIGKFGEGMKFAFLVLLRMGCKVKVRTNGLSLVPKLKETFGVNTLSIEYAQTPSSIKGTKVEIRGLKKDYRERFLHLSEGGTKKRAGQGKSKVLLDDDQRGKLYIKGIYVKTLPHAVAGYDLWLERENPLSGDVDMYSVRGRIGHLIRETKSGEYIRRLVRMARIVSEYSEFVESECSVGSQRKSPRMWETAIREQFGTSKVCAVTHLDAARLAEYKGWVTFRREIPFMQTILRRDVDVVKMPKREKEKRVNKTGLSSLSKKNLRQAVRIVEKATKTRIKKVMVVQFLEDPNQRGEARQGQWIKIAGRILHDFPTLLEVLIHEMAHYMWGHDDLTHSFQSDMARIAAMVAIHFSTKQKSSPKGKKKGPSCKELVWRKWKDGIDDPEVLFRTVDGQVKIATIKTWLRKWEQGDRSWFPACAR